MFGSRTGQDAQQIDIVTTADPWSRLSDGRHCQCRKCHFSIEERDETLSDKRCGEAIKLMPFMDSGDDRRNGCDHSQK
jgi:hypothetical protein